MEPQRGHEDGTGEGHVTLTGIVLAHKCLDVARQQATSAILPMALACRDAHDLLCMTCRHSLVQSSALNAARNSMQVSIRCLPFDIHGSVAGKGSRDVGLGARPAQEEARSGRSMSQLVAGLHRLQSQLDLSAPSPDAQVRCIATLHVKTSETNSAVPLNGIAALDCEASISRLL